MKAAIVVKKPGVNNGASNKNLIPPSSSTSASPYLSSKRLLTPKAKTKLGFFLVCKKNYYHEEEEVTKGTYLALVKRIGCLAVHEYYSICDTSTMWAITPLSFCSPATVTTRRSNRRPFTVSAKPKKNIKYDYDSDETETDPELETLKQQHVGESEPDTYVSNSDTISGSVVLLALQKASAEKTSKKVKKKKKVKNIKDEDNNNKQQGGVVEDYGDVKELCVKSEWKDRLDELEMQLHQLIHHT